MNIGCDTYPNESLVYFLYASLGIKERECIIKEGAARA